MEFWSRRPIRINLAGMGLATVVWLVLALLLGSVIPRQSLLGSAATLYPSLLIATLLVARYFDGMPAAWTGAGIDRWSGRELAQGIGLGVCMALLAWGPIAIIGGVHAGERDLPSNWLFWIAFIGISAAGEELLFRGYFFQRIAEMIGPGIATVIVSGIFAVAHLWNPSVTFGSASVIFLAGIFFSLCYLRTGSLWLPFGAHFAWNFMIGKILGMPVSGEDFGAGLLWTGIAGPKFLTGGAFGPEGGVMGMIAVAAGIYLVATIPVIRYSPYVNATVFRAIHALRMKRSSPGDDLER
ncbi:MAG: CPBP family intramembrane glutamic endopeptidase [Candidatus Kapaibacterium sp.]